MAYVIYMSVAVSSMDSVNVSHRVHSEATNVDEHACDAMLDTLGQLTYDIVHDEQIPVNAGPVSQEPYTGADSSKGS